MGSAGDLFVNYPVYVPDIDNYVSPNCSYVNVEDLSPFICSLSLSILMLNIRSCKKNFDSFIANFYNCIKSFSCIIFTETWLSEERDKSFEIPGFYCCNLYRNHYGGGIKVYLKNCIKSKILENFTLCTHLFEMLTIELIYCGSKLLLSAIYHPPTSFSTKNIEFVDIFTSHLNGLLQLSLPLIIAGDMNLNLLNTSNNVYIDMFINNLFERNMRPMITRPTKVNLGNTITQFSLIDQIWISGNLISKNSFVVPIGITDHFPVCAVISGNFAESTRTLVKRRRFTIRAKETFNVLVSNVHISVISENVNDIYSKYHEQILQIYDTAFPITLMPIKLKQLAPWMSPRIKQCIRKKSKLYKQYLRGYINKVDYTIYKNRLLNVIRRSKALYYAKMFLENAKDSKMLWSAINGILNKNSNTVLRELMYNGVVLKGEALVDYANDYFVNIVATITTALPSSVGFACLSPPVLASCYFYPTDMNEVTRVIMNLKNKGSKLLDIHPTIIKSNTIIFSNHFMILYNLSLVKSVFPTLLKVARVSPCYKSGQQNIIDNYRPISSLPIFSKVFERLTLIRMESFISRENILTSCQFGFRKGCSTTHAVVKLLSHVVQAYHRKAYSACFFLDLRKAFDTVTHDLLIKKLEHYGFRGHCSEYLKSYYEGRQQYVHIDGYSSTTKMIRYGVPQGSILGPLCFSLYINDMPLSVEEEVILFADDAAFVIVSDTLAGLYQKIRKLFLDLTEYLNMNRLVPNSRKSKLMIFKSRPTTELPNFTFADEVIEWVSEFKYLGMTITNNLNYSKHIDTVSLKVSRMTGTFTCLKSFVPRNILIKLYYALVFPHLNNHVVIWGSAPPSHLRSLTVRINNLLRTILGVRWENGRPLMSNSELYKELNLLNLNSIFKINLYRLLRFLLDGKLPEFWQLLLANHETTHSYNTRNLRFRRPSIVCEIERRALSYQLIKMLDELPPDILEMNFETSLKQFKKYLLAGQ